MSRHYIISATIDLEFNEKNLLQMLTKIKKIGLKIHEQNLGIDDPIKFRELNLYQALSLVTAILKNDINGLELSIDDMYFASYFSKDCSNIRLIFSSFNYYPWVRKFKYYDNEIKDIDIDITRYLRLMLDIIEEYRIISLKIDKE